MSKLKVNELDTESGTTITVTTGKTVVVPVGATITVAGTQTITGTVNLSASTLSLPATLPATALTNATAVPAAQLSGQVPLANLGNVDTSGITSNADDIALLAFRVAANGSFARYNLVDQSVDAFEDATGVDASASTNEIRDSAGKYYYGAISAGEQTVVKSYTGSNQTFVVPAGVDTLNFIAWGGAGGGGNNSIGGGGGFIEGDVTVTAAETLNVKVGGGGLINHAIASNTAGGGGGVGIYRSSTVLAIAGGGGAGENTIDGGAGGGTTGASGANGAGSTTANGGTQSAGGAAVTGGGAGSLNQGGNAPAGTSLSAGGYNGGGSGNGDDATWTAGGGGGGYYGGGSGGATGANHGSGAGGSSLTAGTNTQATGATTPQTGHTNYAAGTGNGVANSAGQHGHAVIKYTSIVIANLTLESTTTTAQAAPTKGDLVFTYTNGAGTAVVGTNITAEYSADAGSTWTDFGIAAGDVQGTTGGHTIVSKNEVSLTSTSGTSMRYRIKTLVQSASMDTRIHAVSLGWS